MDPKTVRTLHRYGALISVTALVIALLAFLVGDPLDQLGPPLALLAPLGAFYFVGAVLVDHPTYRILGEELMRGVVWYGASLVGWAILIDASSVLPATAATVFGLPVATALTLSLAMVGTRRTTGLDLKVQTDGGQLLVAITGAIIGGFVVCYAVLVGDWSPLLIAVYVLATVGGLVLWRWHWRRSSPP